MKVNEFFNFNDSKKENIISHLTKLNIPESSYVINKDYTVDLKKSILIVNNLLEECPVKFNIAEENFIWHYSNLKNLKNFPNVVKGNLVVVSNKLTTLEGSPVITVGKVFNCSHNNLKNLNGSPKFVNSFHCTFCNLGSLIGAPTNITKDFICSDNNLTSLKSSILSIGNTLDCSYNKLNNLIDMPLCEKIKYDGNILSKDIQYHINFPDFKIDDKIIYNKENSKFDGMKGEIFFIEDGSSEDPEIKYQIKFKKVDNLDNPNIDTDKTILHIEKQYIHKIKNPLKDIANTLDDDTKEDLKLGDSIYYVHNKNNYEGIVKKIENDGLVQVEFKSTEGNNLLYYVHKNNLIYKKSKIEKQKIYNPIKDQFKIGDNVVYLDPGGRYDGWEGTISTISYLHNGTHYSINLKSGSISAYVSGVSSKKLEKLNKKTEYQKSEIPKINNFKLHDKILYIKKNSNDYGCKGSIIFINNYRENNYDISIIDNYDISIIDSYGKVKRINFVEADEIKKQIEKFKKGDKIVYDNPNDKQFNKRIGAVKYAGKNDKYKIIFNVDDSVVMVTNVDYDSLVSYEPNIDLSINDDIIYTKIDSPYYSCFGTIISYSVVNDTYDIQINSKDNKNIKIKNIKSFNLEKQPPKRKFRVGDIIRYTNNNSEYNGFRGVVNKRLNKNRYDVTLTNEDKTKNISILTISDYLILLGESKETEDLKYGQKIIYKKLDSVYNNKTGEFKGVRTDGKYELELNNPSIRLWVDSEFVFPTYEDEMKTIDVSTTVDINKKKKKKKIEENKPPVLVYNRRNMVKKSGRKPMPQPDITVNED